MTIEIMNTMLSKMYFRENSKELSTLVADRV